MYRQRLRKKQTGAGKAEQAAHQSALSEPDSAFLSLMETAAGEAASAAAADGQPASASVRSQHVLSVFDTCQTGMTLRVVIFLELLLATAALFMAEDVAGWLVRFAYWTAGVLPAAVVWLLLVCVARRWLERRSEFLQWALCMELGAACGVLACGMLTLGQQTHMAVWGASASSGMLLAAMMVMLLKLRASIAAPATAAARLSQLQSRIRPHFLFNTLNSAMALIRVEPRKAEAVLTDLSALFRAVLQDAGRESTLTQELDLARRYLEIEKVRFDDRLRLRWDIRVDTDSVQLPALTLQPLVENTVKHGVECSAEPVDVLIRCVKRHQKVRLEVRNTLPSEGERQEAVTAGNGMALRNVRERLYLMYDLECDFKAGVRTDGSFLVRIELPADS